MRKTKVKVIIGIFAMLLAMLSLVSAEEKAYKYEAVVTAAYDDIGFFCEGYAPVKVDGKWGYINEKGEYFIEPTYDYAAEFSEGKAVVGMFDDIEEGINGSCTLGFIDKEGNYTPLTAKKYLIDNSWFGMDFNTTVSKDETVTKPKIPILACLFSIDWGEMEIKAPIDWTYTNGYLYIYGPGGDYYFYGIFNENGEMINPYINYNPDFNSEAGERLWSAVFSGEYSDGLIRAVSELPTCDEIIFYDIDKNEKFSKPTIYYSGYDEAGITMSNYYFKTLEEAEAAKAKLDALDIDYFYTNICAFNDGYAAAFAVKNEGAKITPYSFTLGNGITTPTEYSVGFCAFERSDEARFLLLDKDGEVVFTGDYINVKTSSFKLSSVVHNGRIVLKNSAGKWGATDINGNVKIPFEYDDMGCFLDTVTSAKKNGKWYIIDVDGNVVSKTNYELLFAQNPDSKASLAKSGKDFSIVINNKKVSGSEKIASEKYYDTAYGAIVPDDILLIKSGEKYGFAKLEEFDGEENIEESKTEIKGGAHSSKRDNSGEEEKKTEEKTEAIPAEDESKPQGAWKNPFKDVKADDWFYDYVKYASENGIMNGTNEDEFAPDEVMTRAMFVTTLYRAAGEPSFSPVHLGFKDVSSLHYAKTAIDWGVHFGIVSGVSETEFAPDEPITREQMAAIIYRYAAYRGADVSLEKNTDIFLYEDYEDISDYAKTAMAFCFEKGIITGKTSKTLCPLDTATRAQAAAVLMRIANIIK